MTAKKQDTHYQFIEDIEPFFFRHNINYVDSGAYKGEVFKKFIASKLAIGEAHLFEPNSSSFSVLKQTAETIFKGRSLNLFNTALGKEELRVRMQSADTMTRVLKQNPSIASAVSANSNTFEVECSTLDVLENCFTDNHISLLKIDVEGFESQVLAGASNLLSEQRVDVIYIEAGLNPEGEQLCYYRIIDDIMLNHNYRLFRIYEQMHEWMEDSPFLRRLNLAYFSSKFAAKHPYQLTQELFKEATQNRDNLNPTRESGKNEKKIVRLQKEFEEARDEIVQLNWTLKKHQKIEKNRQIEQLTQQIEQMQQSHHLQVGKLEERTSFYQQLYEETKNELVQLRRRFESN